MIGKYKIYKNGVLEREQENLITTFGKKYILKYLSNQVPNIGDSIAVGVSNTAATIGDLTLGFEFSRGLINVRSALVTSGIVIKAELDDTVGGLIYEMGLFPTVSNSSSGQFGTKVLSQCDPSLETWVGVGAGFIGADTTGPSRIGTEMVGIDATASSNINAIFQPFSENMEGYSPLDQLSLAYYNQNSSCNGITVSLLSDSSNYISYTFVPSSVGYFIKSWPFSSMITTGNPDLTNIATLQVNVSANSGGAALISLDGLIITDVDIYQDYGLISHSILTTPLAKLPDDTIEIEYYMDFTING